MTNILIFAEQRHGQLHQAVTQLISAARAIDPGAQISACVVGQGVGDVARNLSGHALARVLVADDARFDRYRPQPYAAAVQAAIQSAHPQIVLLPATLMGRDLAPRIAARVKAALATDCVEARLEGEALIVKRPVYMGKATAELRLDPTRMKIVSIRPNAFAAAEAGSTQAAAVQSLTVPVSAGDDALINHECISTTSGVKDVTEADIIVSGGRSLKSADNFKILYELAQVLDAAVGASRAACDAGYQPHSRQVGLTGKTVTPRLYLAFGIDGAIQHLAGMRGSKVIAAINTKKEAPIFGVATYGCVADLFVMAPLLKEEFRRVLGK